MLLQTPNFCSFLWLHSIPLNIYHIFFVRSSVGGLLVCFHILAIVNQAAMNIWPPDAKSLLLRKDPDDGKDGGQEEKEATEDEMV